MLEALQLTRFYGSVPAVQDVSGLSWAYLFGAIIFASYVPDYEMRIMNIRWATPVRSLPAVLILVGIHHYRKNMLPIDKELIFEERHNT
jgi:hypothetical protein